MAIINTIDNGGKRSGFDRRKFSYDIHIPERRSGKDRRSGVDQRTAALSSRRSKERRRIFQ